MKERFTERKSSCLIKTKDGREFTNYSPHWKNIEKIEEYETAEEEGRLIILPVKPWGPVYCIVNKCKMFVGCDFDEPCKDCEYQDLQVEERVLGLVDIVRNVALFGEKIFPTREEAEKALKGQMEG